MNVKISNSAIQKMLPHCSRYVHVLTPLIHGINSWFFVWIGKIYFRADIIPMQKLNVLLIELKDVYVVIAHLQDTHFKIFLLFKGVFL